MNVSESGATPSTKGPVEYFTGAVRIDFPFCGRGNFSGATAISPPTPQPSKSIFVADNA